MYRIIVLGIEKNIKYKLGYVVATDNKEFFWNSHVPKGSNYHASLHKNGKHWIKETKRFKHKLEFGRVGDLKKFRGHQIIFNQTFVKQYNLNRSNQVRGALKTYDQICEIDLNRCWDQFIIGAGIFTNGYQEEIPKNYIADDLFFYKKTQPMIFIYCCRDARKAVPRNTAHTSIKHPCVAHSQKFCFARTSFMAGT